jgi:hypothetical protein
MQSKGNSKGGSLGDNMKRQLDDSQQSSIGLWLIAFCFAAVLSVGFVGGLWLWLVAGQGWPAFLLSIAVVVAWAGGIVWQSRVRDDRRWKAALDAYAKGDIGKNRRRGASANAV